MKHQTTKAAMDLLLQGQLALADVECNGVRVDKSYLESAIAQLNQKIYAIQKRLEGGKVAKEWKKIFGDKTNLGSRSQLSRVLYDGLGFKPAGETASSTEGKRRYRTDKTALEKIDSPFVRQFLYVESLKKALSTYLIGIQREMVERDGHWFIHPQYNLNTTQTFRSSCDNPNWQNVPVRDSELAEIIRRCYIPRPGRHFVEIDFAQIEVRVSACYNKDPNLINYIKDKSTDMHRDMACEIFGLPPKWLIANSKHYKNVRHTAKNMFVFPEFYGSVFFQCAPFIWDAIAQRQLKTLDGRLLYSYMKEKLGITELGTCSPDQKAFPARPGTFEYHLKRVEEKLWKKFAVYAQWKRDTYDQYVREGGCTSYVGFAFTGNHKRNDVVNYRIQCDAFMCELWSLIRLNRWLKKNRMRSLCIGEIHDSTQLDVSPRELDDVLGMAHEIMTVKLPKAWDWINVPIETESEVSPVNKSWFEKEVWESDTEGKWWSKSYIEANKIA